MKIKNLFFRSLLFVVLIFGLFFAGYTQKIIVQVFDQNLRPIEGAEVYVEHQLNSVAGFIKTKSVYTNSTGNAEITFSSLEDIDSEVDYTYRVFFKYGNQTSIKTLIADNSGKPRIISETTFYSYFLRVNVLDQNRFPLSADVTIGRQTKKTDKSGSVLFQLPPGETNIKAESKDFLKIKKINLQSDFVEELIIELYNLEVNVIDENEKFLPAEIEVAGKKVNTESGKAFFYNLTDPYLELLVKTEQKLKKSTLDLKRNNKVVVVFDRQKPIIREKKISILPNNVAVLSIFAQDQGKFASGIETININYEVNGVENQIPAYSVGYNTFEARFPAYESGTTVKYTIKISDKEGNTNFESGFYLIEQQKENPQNTQQGQTENFSLDFTAIIIGAVVAFIVLLAIFYYLKNRNKG